MVWYLFWCQVLMTHQKTAHTGCYTVIIWFATSSGVSWAVTTHWTTAHKVIHCHYLVCHFLWCQLGSNDTLDNCTHTFALQAKILYPFAFTFLALKRTLVFIFFLRFYRKYSYIHNYAVTELSRDLDWWFLADMRASPCAVIVMSCCV